MGLDLQLLPLSGERYPYNNATLHIPRNDALFTRIKTVTSQPISKDFACWPLETNRITFEDAYGDSLMFVFAKELKKENIGGPVGAYVNALTDEAKIVLYWH